MAANFTEIRGALREPLLDVSGISETNVAFQHRPFNPAANSPWYRETLLPGTEDLTSYKMLSIVGLYQIDAFWPRNSKLEELEAKLALIVEAFAPKQSLTNGSSSVTIERASRGPIVAEDSYVRGTVRVQWRTFSDIQ